MAAQSPVSFVTRRRIYGMRLRDSFFSQRASGWRPTAAEYSPAARSCGPAFVECARARGFLRFVACLFADTENIIRGNFSFSLFVLPSVVSMYVCKKEAADRMFDY